MEVEPEEDSQGCPDQQFLMARQYQSDAEGETSIRSRPELLRGAEAAGAELGPAEQGRWGRVAPRARTRETVRRTPSVWLNDGSCIRLRLLHENHVWSYDFVSTTPDASAPDGRRTIEVRTRTVTLPRTRPE